MNQSNNDAIRQVPYRNRTLSRRGLRNIERMGRIKTVVGEGTRRPQYLRKPSPVKTVFGSLPSKAEQKTAFSRPTDGGFPPMELSG